MADSSPPEGALRKVDGLDVYDVDDDTVILHLATREVHKLNASAAFLWYSLDQHNTLDELALALSEAADIPEQQARQDAAAFISALREQGLLKETS